MKQLVQEKKRIIVPVKHSRGMGNCSVIIGVEVLNVNMPLATGNAIVLVHNVCRCLSCSSINS